MRARKIESLLAWFRKRHLIFAKEGIFAWYNIHKELDEKDIQRIDNFCKKREEIDFCIIISGINELRPQRTWGDIPQWFRNNTAWHYICHAENSFVFINYKQPLENKPYFNEDYYNETKPQLFENVKELAKQAQCEYRIFEYSK